MADHVYDLVVIGGGAGGFTAAKFARGLGKKVILIEKNKLGGECTWTGCVPSKALIRCAEVAHYITYRKVFGLSALQKTSLETRGVMPHIRRIIDRVYSTHTPESFTQQGIDILFGNPTFIDAHSLQLQGKTIVAKSCIITTGSSPFVPPIDGIEQVAYLTNENLFDLETLPRSMIILGGGPIGAEIASALNRLGVDVVVLEMQERILPREDKEVALLLSDTMQQEGVKIHCGMKAMRVEQKKKIIEVTCQDATGQEKIFSAETFLVAVGRQPNIAGLNLEAAGVTTTSKGIEVDRFMRTHTRHIYAAGDVVGPYQFSHMAWRQAMLAARNALLPFKKAIDYSHVAWVTFTAPELASAGMTEQQARERYGEKIRIYRQPYASIDRARTDCSEIGLAKFICDKKGRLLGVHILGKCAGELIAEIQLGKQLGLRFSDFYLPIHPYPTYAELIWHAAKQAYIDRLQRNPFLRLLRLFFGSKERG